MKKSLATLLLLILSACGGGGGNSAAQPEVASAPLPTDLTATEQFTQKTQGLALPDYYAVSFGELLRRSPESMVSSSLDDIYPLFAARLNNWSENYQDETWAIYQLALDALHTYDRSSLNVEGQLEYDIYDWWLQDALAEQPFKNYSFVASYGHFGIPRTTQRFLEELHPLETVQDAEDFLERLGRLDTKFAQIENHVLRQHDAGIVEPALTMQVAINGLAAIAQTPAAQNPIYLSFSDKIDHLNALGSVRVDNWRNTALNSIATDVIPAYQRLLNTLQGLLADAPANIGVGQYAGGAAYYEYALQHHTTTDLTAAEIHQLGLDHLDRIHAEMRAIFDQLGYPQNETLPELYARVEADGGIVSAADSFQTFVDLVAFAEANLPQAFDVFPMADIVVLPDPFGGFYISPSFDGTRPGAFYAGTDFDQPYATMPTLTFHESLPGHHMQIAIQGEANVALFRKVVRSTAFTEGWALYAERLAFELGWYDNDVYGNLGRLQFEALRAARLVMDTGIHSLGWTFDQATQFNQDNVGAGVGASQGAAARYSVIPGQATAYMIGMLQILSERQRAMDTLGVDFSLIAFHRAVLTNGAVPLSLFSGVVDRYIADAQ